jgi:hypothetical protein
VFVELVGLVAMSKAEVTMGEAGGKVSGAVGRDNSYCRASGRVSERAAGLGEIWLGRVCFGAGVSPNKGLPSI